MQLMLVEVLEFEKQAKICKALLKHPEFLVWIVHTALVFSGHYQ